MKKSLLFSAALATACSAFAGAPAIVKADASSFSVGPKAVSVSPKATTRAMESFDFTYAETPYSSLSLNGTTSGKTRVFMLFQMAPEDIQLFAGSKVTDFTVYSPTNDAGNSNTMTEGRFFYTTDPTLSTEDYIQDFTMSKIPYDVNKVALDTPYTITGDEEALFFGYSVVVKRNMYYVTIDDVPNVDTTGILGVSSDGESMPESYQVFGSTYGALCMSVTLEREQLPKTFSFSGFPATVCLPLGESLSLPVTVRATSGTPIESFAIEYTLGGTPYASEFEFYPAVPSGAGRYIDVNLEFPAQNEKLNEQVEFKISKINGVDYDAAGATAEATVVVVDEVPVHQTLYEEYTGTWCGYCPRGFAALEYIAKNHPDFVVASFHSGTQGASDPMQVTNDFPSEVSGFPGAVLNRSYQIDPYYGTQQFMDMELPVVGDILALNAIPTTWRVSVSHEWDGDVLVANAEVANVAGFKNKNYKIAYLLVADGLTGKSRNWYQSNYYNTETPQYIPELNEFCRGGEYGRSSVAGLVFNDVVVSADGIHGEEGSIPATLAAEEVAAHSMRFDISKISENLIPDRSKLRVIAAVVDAYGSVLNCAKDEVNDYGASGVADIVDENAPVEYFNLNGMKVANPSEGVFIRRQGAKAEKVIVK